MVFDSRNDFLSHPDPSDEDDDAVLKPVAASW